MGVKDLWSVVSSVCETVPLTTISGQSVAVDLSGWLVESENASWSHTHSRAYLRTLVYRVSALLLQATVPVCVFDGDAPQLKLDELINRRRQCRRAVDHSGSSTRVRHRLRGLVRRCLPLLEALGVPNIQAIGEAERLCCHLALTGRVSGVLSDDSDTLLYGAPLVYRQLRLSGGGGQLVSCRLKQVEEQLHLSVSKLQLLAVLLGCDFLPAGLPGVGVQTALHLASQWDTGRPGEQLLDRLRFCVELAERDAASAAGIASSSSSCPVSHCSHCCHVGSVREHRRSGCLQCSTSVECLSLTPTTAKCPCDWHVLRRWREEHTAELRCGQKLLQLDDVEGWFDRARRTIHEFTSISSDSSASSKSSSSRAVFSHQSKSNVSDNVVISSSTFADETSSQFNWSLPDPLAFCRSATTDMDWSEDQALALVLPLLTRWQVSHCADSPLQLRRIVRASRHNHLECYLLEWQVPPSIGERLFLSHEPRQLVARAFHSQLQEFSAKSTCKPRRAKTSRAKRKSTAAKSICDYFRQISLQEQTEVCTEQNVSPDGREEDHCSDDASNLEALNFGARELPGDRQQALIENRRLPSERSGVCGEAYVSQVTGITPEDGVDSSFSRTSSDEDSQYDEVDLSAIIDEITGTHIGHNAVCVNDSDVISEGDEPDRNDAGIATWCRMDESRARFSLGISAWLDNS